jgi:hypothetical protein
MRSRQFQVWHTRNDARNPNHGQALSANGRSSLYSHFLRPGPLEHFTDQSCLKLILRNRRPSSADNRELSAALPLIKALAMACSAIAPATFLCLEILATMTTSARRCWLISTLLRYPSWPACAARTAPQRWVAATNPAAMRPSRMWAIKTSIAACHSALLTFCAIPSSAITRA